MRIPATGIHDCSSMVERVQLKKENRIQTVCYGESIKSMSMYTCYQVYTRMYIYIYTDFSAVVLENKTCRCSASKYVHSCVGILTK